MKWQSIDTAPEQQIILLGYFGEVEDYAPDHPHADCWVQLGRINRFYRSDVAVTCIAGGADNHTVALNTDLKPTHWMPLPEAPEDKE